MLRETRNKTLCLYNTVRLLYLIAKLQDLTISSLSALSTDDFSEKSFPPSTCIVKHDATIHMYM